MAEFVRSHYPKRVKKHRCCRNDRDPGAKKRRTGLTLRAHAKNDRIEDHIAHVADAAEDKVIQARQKLRSALDSTKEAVATVQTRVAECADVTDQLIRDRPYHAIGIAFGLGAVIGY
jgi:ElaB/YqjD/DUF883 family membrane-anchored ribosome-binding protein